MQKITEPAEDYGRLKLFINGSWVESKSQDARDAFNPAKGLVIAEVPFALSEEVVSAVEAGQNSFEKWRYVPIIERVKYLFRMKDTLERHAEELAVLNSQNHGKTIEESHGDLRRTIENVDAALAAAYTLSKGDNLEQIAPGIDIQTAKEPLGVFAIVCPFNFPLMIPFWFIPYAIVLGDTLVVKPSEITPLPMALAAKLIQEEVGLPAGVLNMVHGGREVVKGLISARDVRGVTFVGSSPVAKQVYKLAGEHGKRVIANGGAKNTIVVLPDAGLGESTPSIVSSFFGNTGQRCLAGANLVAVGEVHEPLLQKFTSASSALKVGYGLEEGVEMGPLVSAKAKERTEDYLEIGEREGAKLVADGRKLKVGKYPGGFYLGASIFDGVDPSMKISKEEIFGPVASVISVGDLDDAIDAINKNTNFGNMACIYTSSGKAAREFRRRVDAGNIGVNIGVAAPPGYFPFGGRRDSFYGVLHAQMDTVDFFTDKKVTVSRW